MVRVKICGITNIDDALMAIHAGADALGFVFAPSPRQITPAEASAILAELPPFVTIVGLVVDQDASPILEQCPRLDVIQFHGSEAPEIVAACQRRSIKAFRLRDSSDLAALSDYGAAAALLLDAYVAGVAGGTGAQFPWELAVQAQAPGRRIIVAGGLTPENVAECVRVVRPYAVDVSSGVESEPGRKCAHKVARFIAATKGAVV
jgi:phosphoribosylanthranilate isomerase